MMKNKYKELSIELLNKIISYNAETGTLLWKEMSIETGAALGKNTRGIIIFNSKVAHTAISNITNQGYVRLSIRIKGNKHEYRAHRVAWALHYGEWPVGDMDHINGDRADNRIENIRLVSISDNQRNLCMPKNNTSGQMGVHYDKRIKKWIARISDKNKKVQLGSYVLLEDAIKVRKKAEKDYGYHENHGRKAVKNYEN